jgi:hypothetical protein
MDNFSIFMVNYFLPADLWHFRGKFTRCPAGLLCQITVFFAPSYLFRVNGFSMASPLE